MGDIRKASVVLVLEHLVSLHVQETLGKHPPRLLLCLVLSRPDSLHALGDIASCPGRGPVMRLFPASLMDPGHNDQQRRTIIASAYTVFGLGNVLALISLGLRMYVRTRIIKKTGLDDGEYGYVIPVLPLTSTDKYPDYSIHHAHMGVSISVLIPLSDSRCNLALADHAPRLSLWRHKSASSVSTRLSRT